MERGRIPPARAATTGESQVSFRRCCDPCAGIALGPGTRALSPAAGVTPRQRRHPTAFTWPLPPCA